MCFQTLVHNGVNAVDGSWHYQAMKSTSARGDWHFNDTHDVRVKRATYLRRCAGAMDWYFQSRYWKRQAIAAGFLPELDQPTEPEDETGMRMPKFVYQPLPSKLALEHLSYDCQNNRVRNLMSRGWSKKEALDHVRGLDRRELSQSAIIIREGGIRELTTSDDKDAHDDEPAPATPTMEDVLAARGAETAGPSPTTPTGEKPVKEEPADDAGEPSGGHRVLTQSGDPTVEAAAVDENDLQMADWAESIRIYH